MIADSWFWVLLIVVLILVIVFIIAAAAFYANINSINNTGVSWRVQDSTGSTDVMKTGGNNWYLAHTSDMLIRIASDPNNVRGKEIRIQNMSSGIVNIDTTQLSSYFDATLSKGKAVDVGALAIFVFTGTNKLIRST